MPFQSYYKQCLQIEDAPFSLPVFSKNIKRDPGEFQVHFPKFTLTPHELKIKNTIFWLNFQLNDQLFITSFTHATQPPTSVIKLQHKNDTTHEN